MLTKAILMWKGMSKEQSLEAINPASGLVIGTYPLFTKEEIIEAIELADIGFQQWKQTEFALRAKALNQVAKTLRSDKHKLAECITKLPSIIPS